MTPKFILFPVIALIITAGCAPKNWNSEEDGPFDPLEDVNRAVFRLNSGLDTLLLKPAATAYEKFPAPVKTGVGNIFSNLAEPANAVNNALQKEGSASINSTARFVINSVFGLGGLIDVANMWDIPEQKADLGQTLRGYGMKNSAYLVLPLLGSSTFADSLGNSGDRLLAPQNYITNSAPRNTVTAVRAVHIRTDLLPLTRLAEEISLDEYFFIRDSYEQKRQEEVKRIFGGR